MKKFLQVIVKVQAPKRAWLNKFDTPQ